MHPRLLRFIGLTLLLGAACGGENKAIPLTDLPPKLAAALCMAYERCYGPVFELFLNGTDCVSVTEQRIRNGSFALLPAAIEQGSVVYDGARAQACLDSLGSRTCAELFERDSDACLAALDGTVAMGGACSLDDECKGQALCKSTAGTCPGQCAPLMVAGQACREDADCQSGLVCSAETRLCVAPAGAGQPCEYGAAPCGAGLLCLGKDDDARTPGTCKTPAEALAAAPGAACDATHGLLCQPGSSCVAESVDILALSIDWQCVATGSYFAGGECKPGFPDACASGSYCKTGISPLSGTCSVIPAAGEACASGLSRCRPGAACVGGVCQNLVANGVGCTGDAMCWSDYCGPSGGCEARLPCR